MKLAGADLSKIGDQKEKKNEKSKKKIPTQARIGFSGTATSAARSFSRARRKKTREYSKAAANNRTQRG